MNKNSFCPFILHSWWEITSHFLIICAINFYFVPNSFGIQEKLHFSKNLWDAHRPTSTQLRLSEIEDKYCKKAFFFILFFNSAHSGVNCIPGKSSRMTGFFFGQSLFFVNLFHWVNIYYCKKMKSQFCHDKKPVSVIATILHHVRINTGNWVRGTLGFQWDLFNRPHVKRHWVRGHHQIIPFVSVPHLWAEV